VVELLFALNAQAGTALVLVTHNHELAALTAHTIRLRDGVML
jgi:putative ABC transport system ATP-binding protein